MNRTNLSLLAIVGVLIAATAVGLFALWPSSSELPAPGEPPPPLIDGRIATIEEAACGEDAFGPSTGPCLRVGVEVLAGPDAGRTTTIDVRQDEYPSFDVGDEVKLLRNDPGGGGEVRYFIQDFARLTPLYVLIGLFVVAVLAVGRLHGLRSLVGLALSLLVIVKFVVPAILAGTNPSLVAVVGAMAIMLATLYLTHGLSEMTTAAVVGTGAALLVTLLLGLAFVALGKLTGFASENAQFARFAVEGLDLKGLVLAGLIIGTLGVLDDVTVSQASTVFAVHGANPQQSWTEVFRRAMSVGRDHIASTVNTLFLAYAGASLALLVLFSTGGVPVMEIVNSELFAEELIRTLVGSIGLVSAVPLTTALATSLAVRGRPIGGPAVHAHPHAYLPPEPAPGDDPGENDRAYESWLRYLKEGERDD